MSKYWKIMLLVIAAGWMISCEQNPPSRGSEPCLVLINELDGEATLLIDYNGKNVGLTAEAGQSNSMNMEVVSRRLGVYGGFYPDITVKVWNPVKVTYETIFQEVSSMNVRHDFRVQVCSDKTVILNP